MCSVRCPRYEILELKDSRLLEWTVLTATALFGVVSSSCGAGSMATVTTMVTGHILTLSNLVGCWLYQGFEDFEWQKWWISLAVLAGNVSGACLGSWASRAHLPALLLPIPFGIYLLLHLHDQLAKPSSWTQRVGAELHGTLEGKQEGKQSDEDEVETQEGDKDLESHGSESQAPPLAREALPPLWP